MDQYANCGTILPKVCNFTNHEMSGKITAPVQCQARFNFNIEYIFLISCNLCFLWHRNGNAATKFGFFQAFQQLVWPFSGLFLALFLLKKSTFFSRQTDKNSWVVFVFFKKTGFSQPWWVVHLEVHLYPYMVCLDVIVRSIHVLNHLVTHSTFPAEIVEVDVCADVVDRYNCLLTKLTWGLVPVNTQPKVHRMLLLHRLLTQTPLLGL